MIHQTTNYEQAVAHEEALRRLGWMQVAFPLLTVPQVALTWRHVAELTYARNAYFAMAEPTAHDQWLFLWRLHPAFTRPDGTQPNRRAGSGAPRAGRIAVLRARAHVWQASRRLDPLRTESRIVRRIEEAYLDVPAEGSKGGETRGSLSLKNYWLDFFVQYFVNRGHSVDQALDTGVAQSFQILRAELIDKGEGDEKCIPPSAALKRFDS